LLPGIGKTLEEKLVALIETGEIPAVTKLRAKFPSGLVAMTRLPGLGPKRARKLFDLPDEEK
jgi:DNA polymerase (family 10)